MGRITSQHVQPSAPQGHARRQLTACTPEGSSVMMQGSNGQPGMDACSHVLQQGHARRCRLLHGRPCAQLHQPLDHFLSLCKPVSAAWLAPMNCRSMRADFQHTASAIYRWTSMPDVDSVARLLDMPPCTGRSVRRRADCAARRSPLLTGCRCQLALQELARHRMHGNKRALNRSVTLPSMHTLS